MQYGVIYRIFRLRVRRGKIRPGFLGSLVQSAIGAHIFNTTSQASRAFYWHGEIDGAGEEVDFALRRGPHTIAIEVKSGRKSKRLRGLEAFEKKFKPYRTMRVGEEGDVSVPEFLSTPVLEWFSK